MAKLRSRPPLFRSKKTQTTTNSVRKSISNSTLGDHYVSSDNFLLDSYQSGFKSTQQLEIDFSKFENHTFLSPARSKVDVALFKCINQFPYTGSQSQAEEFITKLTGFEKYVFDQIPKNKGYLFFSGTQPGEAAGGTFISVSPFSGNEFKGSPGSTGENSLIVNSRPFEIEAHLYLPEILNKNQIICQRNESDAAFTLAVSSSTSIESCKLLFLVSSGSDAYVVASGSFSKGGFSHIRACLTQESDGKKAKIFVDSQIIGSSSDTQDFGNLSFGSSKLNIGSGSTHSILDYIFTPEQTLSGAVDEFRFYTAQRSEDSVDYQKNRQVFATSSLNLYFRFDEPFGSYDMNDVVLDHSGKCLHSRIQNFSQALRNNSEISNPMILQDQFYSPVLYPDFSDFSSLIDRLITSASDYDEYNPNAIYNLVPIHYLKESAQTSGLPDFDSGIGDAPTLENVPGTGQLPNMSPLLRILIITSISLDEIKQFIDNMSTILAIEPGAEDQVSGQMIRFAAQYFGIDLPNFFAKSTTNQFSFGEDIYEDAVAEYTLRSLRDDLWRRILHNMPYILSSKGTSGAVRSILLASGIIPENFFSIREFGMSGEVRLSDIRDRSDEVISVIDFSQGTKIATGSFVPPGVRQDSPRMISEFLSGSRVEVGRPQPAGNFVNKNENNFHGVSNNVNDGLFTSGSFSLEASFIFDKNVNHSPQQSLFRLITTGSASPFSFLVGNVYFDQKDTETGNLTFALRPSAEVAAVSPAPMVLFLSGVSLFDGEKWTVGIERKRKDEIGDEILSSSYTLRCARQVGDQVDFFKSTTFYSETSIFPALNVLENIIPTFNASGSCIIIGSQSISTASRFLNTYSSYISSIFTGKVTGIRFESAAIGDKVFIERARNFANIGMTDPERGLGFDLVQTGAFERLRLDVSSEQATTSSDGNGKITLFDFSQNSRHFQGSGFESNSQIIKPQIVSLNRLSPRFDLQQVTNKVRVRGLDNPSQTDPDFVVTGPAYEIYDVNEIIDDVRFAIEHSVVKALNEDIVSTVGDPQYLEDAMGRPVFLFTDTYPRLDHFSDVYFNRLIGKMDLSKTYDVFRWVDVALTDLVESILPKRTKFMGINYIVEPHILERAKVKYRFQESMMLNSKDDGLKFEALSPEDFSSLDRTTFTVVASSK